LAFAVFLMAQAGVPFTTGFLAKFLVISAAVKSGSYALALIGMLAAAVAAFFYLRLIGLMYMSEPDGDEEGAAAARLPLPATTGVALAVALGVTVVFGMLPAMVDFARQASSVF
jgi:NADH-quinone oxidoreductase subunit N